MVVQVSLDITGSVVVQVSLLYNRVLWWYKLACYIQGSVVVTGKLARVLWWYKLACYIQGSVVVQVSLLYPGFCGGTS